MANFSIQINYLIVLAFATAQAAARKISKLSNDTHDELTQAGSAKVLVSNLTNATGLAEGRDNYSYYYGLAPVTFN